MHSKENCIRSLGNMLLIYQAVGKRFKLSGMTLKVLYRKKLEGYLLQIYNI